MTHKELHALYMREYTRKNRDRINAQRNERAAKRRALGVTPRRRFTTAPCRKCGGTDRFPSGSCKACIKASNARRAREHPELVREQLNERQRRYQAKLTPEEKRQRNRKHNLAKALKTFGLTHEQYDAMLASQGGACAICREPPAGRHRLHIDHDHESGEVRSLLCSGCNTALGSFSDDTDLLRAAIQYIESHKAKRLRLVKS